MRQIADAAIMPLSKEYGFAVCGVAPAIFWASRANTQEVLIMKVFVSGGAGQIGSHVIEMLLERGDRVLAVDNYATGRPEHLPTHPNFTFVEGSIADKPLVDQLIGDLAPEVLIHTAASYKDPDDWYSDTMTNAVGGANLIKAAKVKT